MSDNSHSPPFGPIDPPGAAAPQARERLNKLLAKQLRNFSALFAQVLVDDDPEAVHDLRVCTRRLQQIISALGANATSKARGVRRTLRRVRRLLGAWRNCDVALQRVARAQRGRANPARKAGWELVHESIAAERTRTIKNARHKLYKSGAITLIDPVQQMLSAGGRHHALDPLETVRQAAASAAQRWHQALNLARTEPSVENVHTLRIASKRLRYRVELARELGVDNAAAVISWLKLLQDHLGHWHDRQELSRFIARALAADEVMITRPRVAMEMLKQIEKEQKAGAREAEQLFALTADSAALDGWMEAWNTAATVHTEADPAPTADFSAGEPAADGKVPIG